MSVNQGLINVKSFEARTEGVRPEWPRCEAGRAESVVGFLRRGSQPPPHQLGGLGERCKLPSGFWGGAPAKIEFDAF